MGKKRIKKTAKRSDSEADSSGKLFANLREDLIKHLALAVPFFAVDMILHYAGDRFFTQPGQTLWFVLPFILLTVLLWWRLKKETFEFKMRKPFLIFFFSYALIFSIAAGGGLFDWKRNLHGYDDAIPKNWLSLNRLGDWRYWLIERKEPLSWLMVISMLPPVNKNQGRMEILQLINMASAEEAKGIAFDFDLEGKSDVDPLLCMSVANTRVPIVFGYGIDENLDSTEPKSAIKKCPAKSDVYLAHLIGYAEHDGRVRMIPLTFKDTDLPSISLKTAELEGKNISKPATNLLQFVAPQTDFTVISFHDLLADPSIRHRLYGKYLLVGEFSNRDRQKTPFGEKEGVLIHGYAVQSLLTGRFITRMSWWSDFPILILLMFVLTLAVLRGTNIRHLLLLNGLMSTLIVVVAALAIRLFLLWIDVVYVLLAIWIMLPLLLFLREYSSIGSAYPD